MKTQRQQLATLRYSAMIGCGGIGSGMFFALEGNATLGREESRGGVILDRRDYCKLHIISHYVQRICGPQVKVLPVGAVGNDAAGSQLRREMHAAGLDTRFVDQIPDAPTLFSFCFIYPDGSGGNITTTDSAASRTSPEALNHVEPVFEQYTGRGIALAVPEAPLNVRRRLLDLATHYNWYRAGSFTSGETATAISDGWLDRLDLLAINADEAAAFAGRDAGDATTEENVSAAVEVIARAHPRLTMSITAGRSGSWCWDGSKLSHHPIIPVEVNGTAGAGDAHLSGVLCALIGGASALDAHKLGALAGSLAVTSPHTIHPGLNRDALVTLAQQHGINIYSIIESLRSTP